MCHFRFISQLWKNWNGMFQGTDDCFKHTVHASSYGPWQNIGYICGTTVECFANRNDKIEKSFAWKNIIDLFLTYIFSLSLVLTRPTWKYWRLHPSFLIMQSTEHCANSQGISWGIFHFTCLGAIDLYGLRWFR